MAETSKKKYKSRRVRTKKPSKVEVQERDYMALVAVNKHRVLSQEQLHDLIYAPSGASRQVTTRRLRKLFDNRLLARKEVQVSYGEGSSPVLYILDSMGARALEIPFYHTSKDLSQYYLAHTKGVNDFVVPMMLEAIRLGYNLNDWLTERELKDDHDRVMIEGQRFSVVPDAYLPLASSNQTHHFFLELDRATSGVNRIRKRKIQPYNVYLRRSQKRVAGGMEYGDSQANSRFGTNDLKILFVIDTKFKSGVKRIKSLIEGTREELSLSAEDLKAKSPSGIIPMRDRFLFTTFPEISQENVLKGKIWYGLASTEPVSLL